MSLHFKMEYSSIEVSCFIINESRMREMCAADVPHDLLADW